MRLGFIGGGVMAEAQVEPGKIRVAILEMFDDTQGLAIVVKPALVGKQLVENILPEMPERRVSEIVGQRE